MAYCMLCCAEIKKKLSKYIEFIYIQIEFGETFFSDPPLSDVNSNTARRVDKLFHRRGPVPLAVRQSFFDHIYTQPHRGLAKSAAR